MAAPIPFPSVSPDEFERLRWFPLPEETSG